jgi:hypothetical protein
MPDAHSEVPTASGWEAAGSDPIPAGCAFHSRERLGSLTVRQIFAARSRISQIKLSWNRNLSAAASRFVECGADRNWSHNRHKDRVTCKSSHVTCLP